MFDMLVKRLNVGGSADAHRETLRTAKAIAEIFHFARVDEPELMASTAKANNIEISSTDCTDDLGRNALHVAARAGAASSVRALIETHMIDVTAKDRLGRTCIDEARECGDKKGGTIIKFLQAMAALEGSAKDGMLFSDFSQLNMSTNDADGWGDTYGSNESGSAGTGNSRAFEYVLPRSPNVLPPIVNREKSVLPTVIKPGGRPQDAEAVLAEATNTSEWEIKPEHIEVKQCIGEGAFGVVHLASWRGANVALKRLKDGCERDSVALREFQREMAVWCRCFHPNIVPFFGVVTPEDGTPALVSEYMPGGSLQSKMQDLEYWGKQLRPSIALRYAMGIAAAMAYLHSRTPVAVMHRDLKPANCLIDELNRVRLSDFGLSKLIHHDSIGESESQRGASWKYVPLDDRPFLMTGETGAYRYMAPEVFRGELYSMKSDVYSFAMIVYELYEGTAKGTAKMGKDPVRFAQGAANKNSPYRPPWVWLSSPDKQRAFMVKELIESCWRPDAVNRPPFHQICEQLMDIAATPEDAPHAPTEVGSLGHTSARGGPQSGCCAVQ